MTAYEMRISDWSSDVCSSELERPPEQQAMRFDVADLATEVLPETRRLKGVATLTFTATAPLARLVIDLDTNLGPQGIAIDGKTLPASAWSNRSEEQKSELQSLMHNSYPDFCLQQNTGKMDIV